MPRMTVEEAYDKKYGKKPKAKKRKSKKAKPGMGLKAGPLASRKAPKSGVYGEGHLKHRPKSGKFRGKGKSRERYDELKKKWVRDPE
jgi:hypothetical protein